MPRYAAQIGSTLTGLRRTHAADLGNVGLEPGSIFGELSFFDRMPRSAQVSVLEDCSVLKISEGAFKQLLEQDPETAVAFMMEMSRILSLRLRNMNQLVQTLLS